MTDKSPQLDSLFLAAIEIESAEQRATFLESACGTDPELRQQVERLLRSHQHAGSFLEQPPAEFGATILTEPFNPDRAGALEAGLTATFTEDQAVVIGHAGHSVLKNLSRTVDVRRVVLRKSVEHGVDPIVRPKSAEMPDRGSDSRYQLQGEIARGGMGAILKGRDTDLGRDLAIKVLLDAHKDKPDVVQRFIEEAQIGGQLQHPGIAPIYELGQFADKRPFFAMKLVKTAAGTRDLGLRGSTQLCGALGDQDSRTHPDSDHLSRPAREGLRSHRRAARSPQAAPTRGRDHEPHGVRCHRLKGRLLARVGPRASLFLGVASEWNHV